MVLVALIVLGIRWGAEADAPSTDAGRTAQGEAGSTINPGYDPSPAEPPAFGEARESRPPVADPAATPEQTWPTFPSPGETLTGWVEMDGEDRGRYRVPADWTVKPGLMVGYETLHEVVITSGVAFYREDQCAGENHYGFAGLRPASDVSPRSAAYSDVTTWAQIRNTEYEGDYYEIPEPEFEDFTFDNGNTGALATVSFVPMYPRERGCSSAAMRFTAVAQEHEGLTYRMIVVAHIGHEDALSVEEERAVLATFDVPA